jgi:hypothetical protein
MIDFDEPAIVFLAGAEVSITQAHGTHSLC